MLSIIYVVNSISTFPFFLAILNVISFDSCAGKRSVTFLGRKLIFERYVFLCVCVVIIIRSKTSHRKQYHSVRRLCAQKSQTIFNFMAHALMHSWKMMAIAKIDYSQHFHLGFITFHFCFHFIIHKNPTTFTHWAKKGEMKIEPAWAGLIIKRIQSQNQFYLPI